MGRVREGEGRGARPKERATRLHTVDMIMAIESRLATMIEKNLGNLISLLTPIVAHQWEFLWSKWTLYKRVVEGNNTPMAAHQLDIFQYL